MLRSKIVKYSEKLDEMLDKTLIDLQDYGCSISEVRSTDFDFLILYDDPYVHIRVPEEETDESDDEDLTNEEKFLKDWGRRPIHANVVGSMAYEYVCPAITGLPFDQKAYNPETGLCSADDWLSSGCRECAKRFWKSKYKKPEKKEV